MLAGGRNGHNHEKSPVAERSGRSKENFLLGGPKFFRIDCCFEIRRTIKGNGNRRATAGESVSSWQSLTRVPCRMQFDRSNLFSAGKPAHGVGPVSVSVGIVEGAILLVDLLITSPSRACGCGERF